MEKLHARALRWASGEQRPAPEGSRYVVVPVKDKEFVVVVGDGGCFYPGTMRYTEPAPEGAILKSWVARYMAASDSEKVTILLKTIGWPKLLAAGLTSVHKKQLDQRKNQRCTKTAVQKLKAKKAKKGMEKAAKKGTRGQEEADEC